MFTLNLNLNSLNCFGRRRKKKQKDEEHKVIEPTINMTEVKTLLENMGAINDLSKLQIILFKLMSETVNIGMIMKLTINKNGIPTVKTICTIGLQLSKVSQFTMINYPIIRKGVIIGSLSIGSSEDILLNDIKYQEILDLIGDSLSKL